MFGFQLKDSQPKENSRITFHGQLVLFSNKQCSSQAHTCLAHKNTCLWAVHSATSGINNLFLCMFLICHVRDRKWEEDLQNYQMSTFSKFSVILLLEAIHISVLPRDSLSSCSGRCFGSLSVLQVYDSSCYPRIFQTVYYYSPPMR